MKIIEESTDERSKRIHDKYKHLIRESVSTNYTGFPQIGDKLKFKGVPSIYYPMFTNIGKFASDNLKTDQEYIVTKSEVYSSWCAVWLDGFGENFFHYQFFHQI